MTGPTHTNPLGFKPGDVVMMKMGGPHMTIEQVRASDPHILHCLWFDEHHRLHRDCFDDFALKLVPGGG